MKENIGRMDQITRLLIAIVLFMALYSQFFTGVFEVFAILIAVIFLATGMTRYCPAYRWFNTNTTQT